MTLFGFKLVRVSDLKELRFYLEKIDDNIFSNTLFKPYFQHDTVCKDDADKQEVRERWDFHNETVNKMRIKLFEMEG